MVLIIHNRESNQYFQPAVLDGVAWETMRKGAPGKLIFKVIADSILNFSEGNVVHLQYDGKNVFQGFVFTKKRNKDGVIEVIAYDQLRYLKNKDIYPIVNQTATTVIKNLAANFQLKVGDIADTGYVIPKYRGSNEAVIDIIQTALDMTMENTKKMYVLYDDYGKLNLKNIEDMRIDILIDEETAEDFTYESTIDKDTYNRVKLYYDNKEEGKRDVWMTYDSNTIAKWGVLQLTQSINAKKTLNIQQKADSLLALHNRVGRTLTIQNAIGDVRVRGGSRIYTNLYLGDQKLNSFMLVEEVKHTFSNNQHVMNLTLRGDVITG